MHDLVHDLAISLLGDKILDQSKQGNAASGNRYCYALLSDCSKPLESCMASPAGLSALRFLDCQGTELHGSAFEAAGSLRVLDLSECSIQMLPDSVGRLKQLRYLNAPRIRARMVPECIATLSNLRYLSLRGSCAMLALPELIGGMEGLVHLDLSGCLGIKELSKSFGNLLSLEHLDFSDCKNVTGLSQCLARFTKLQHLNLSNCTNIEDLPIAVGSVKELLYLNLSNSSCLLNLSHSLKGPELLGSLTKLRYLKLSMEKLRGELWLPEVLGSLTGLEYLDLSHNKNMSHLPKSFRNLCNLVHLDLSHCSVLRGLPAVLDGLTKLQYLDLSGLRRYWALMGLQEVFGTLSELRHLNLRGSIKYVGLVYSLPDELKDLLERIFTLTNLEYLNLGDNDMELIPETLGNLRKLHTLDLSYCRFLQRLPASIPDSLKFLYTMECPMLDRCTPPQYGSISRIPFQLTYENSAHLKISRLEKAMSAQVARTIKLVEKTDIIQLKLEWTRGAKRFVDDAEILRELEPPYSILEFSLEGYNSVSFPPWVTRLNDYLPGLIEVEMSDLPSCNNLPPLGQLPNLTYLYIRRMNSIKKIGMDLYGGARAFP
ncbi:hypothetical protein HU200_027001 [Digitaria exilis]|uniref:Uncharacterized protein n=1 Tax=Digitaria exilis TaxID=1010633 RepID=A0A835BYP9_9POAL|nr:hypothetical protein HU200_027001 [Digitaria exilis]